MPSYYSPEMLDHMKTESDAATDRLSVWMARQTIQNMKHVNPDVVSMYGTEEELFEYLQNSYAYSLQE